MTTESFARVQLATKFWPYIAHKQCCQKWRQVAKVAIFGPSLATKFLKSIHKMATFREKKYVFSDGHLSANLI